MWQHLVRGWLERTAREQLHAAAKQAAQGDAAGASAAPREPAKPREPEICHVGVVFALGIEAGGLVDLLAGRIDTRAAGFTAREGGLQGKRVVIVECGAGANAAQAATEALIVGHQPRWVISAGFAGALSSQLRKQDIVMPDRLLTPDGRELAVDFHIDPAVLAGTASLHVGRLLTVDRIVGSASEKLALGERHHALAVDMETFGVAEACRAGRTRFLAVRVISDDAAQQLPPEVDHLLKQTSRAGRFGAAAGAILRRPSSVKDLWQLKEDALVASQRLGKFLAGVIPQLD